ncbi:STAS domain-containing protein [Planctomycetales bacterium ZRK34]|nr:STAS domain-containing protein [Planctomycetales bacterium ZRK34]
MNQFHVNIEDRQQRVVVELSGDISILQTDTLRKAFAPVVERQPAHVVLDLAKLVFINSLGLGALIEFRHNLTQHGSKIHLAGASDRIAEIFRKTRLAELFPMYPTADDALAAE